MLDDEPRAGACAGPQSPLPNVADTQPPLDDEPPVGAGNVVHHLLVGLHALTRLPWPGWTALLIALAAGLGGLWGWQTGSPGATWLAAGSYLVRAVPYDTLGNVGAAAYLLEPLVIEAADE